MGSISFIGKSFQQHNLNMSCFRSSVLSMCAALFFYCLKTELSKLRNQSWVILGGFPGRLSPLSGWQGYLLSLLGREHFKMPEGASLSLISLWDLLRMSTVLCKTAFQSSVVSLQSTSGSKEPCNWGTIWCGYTEIRITSRFLNQPRCMWNWMHLFNLRHCRWPVASHAKWNVQEHQK